MEDGGVWVESSGLTCRRRRVFDGGCPQFCLTWNSQVRQLRKSIHRKIKKTIVMMRRTRRKNKKRTSVRRGRGGEGRKGGVGGRGRVEAIEEEE